MSETALLLGAAEACCIPSLTAVELMGMLVFLLEPIRQSLTTTLYVIIISKLRHLRSPVP